MSSRADSRLRARLILGILAAIVAGSGSSRAQSLDEFALPVSHSGPSGVAVGSDGAIWFTETGRGAIGRIDASGTITEVLIPAIASGTDIVSGPDGALWFPVLVTQGVLALGRLTPAGVYSQIALPSVDPNNGGTGGIAVGWDGNLWMGGGSQILRVTPAGQTTAFPVPSGGNVAHLTTAPDGNVWFTMLPRGNLSISVAFARPDGSITEVRATPSSYPPGGIATGSDGLVWAGETPECGFIPRESLLCGRIVKMDPSGVRDEVTAPDLGVVNGMTNAIDGAVWFTSGFRQCSSLFGCLVSPSRLGRVTDGGVITQFDLAEDSLPQGIVTGPDGNLWFAESGANRIGRLRISSVCRADAHSSCLQDDRFRVQVSYRVTDPLPRGLGTALPLSADAVAFWFFTANNIEVVVKVVDGRAENGKLWVFIGSLSDVEYEVTVTDTQTGEVRRYANPQGSLQSVADTSAF